MVLLARLQLVSAGPARGSCGGGGLAESRCFPRLVTLCAPAGFLAVLAGWLTAEVGRQPWVVQGLMRTVDAVSSVTAPMVAHPWWSTSSSTWSSSAPGTTT